ncbi:MAG: hypothetical protein IJ011_04255 [Clostridia bacterium]|nr:hypothetical protein [Clostridia bacterium]
MKKKNADLMTQIDLTKQTPEPYLKSKASSRLYERAFLSREDESGNEYSRNTTTWD